MDVAPATDFAFFSSSHGGFHYASAPSSPTRLGELYCGFDELLIAAGANRSNSIANVPFAWEEKPGVPKTPDNLYEDDFSFDVSCGFGSGSVAAEDLFHGGIIKTIDLGTRFEERAFNDRHKPSPQSERGRERGFSSSRLPSSRSRRTRSLSPLGTSYYRQERQPMTPRTKPTSTPACSSENGAKRWSFKDLFLFRSASDGRAMDKYPLKKYFTINWRNDQDLRNESESMSKRRGRVSAHGLHYNWNRVNSNEMKKKTYLPYKHGVLGGLSLNS